MVPPCRDRLSYLPAEVLADIFSHLVPDPPAPLSRRLLPYSRTAKLARVQITSVKQLNSFVDTVKASPQLGGYVRSLALDLREPTETILALETAFNDTLVEALALLPAVKEVDAVNWMTTSFLLSDNAVAAVAAHPLHTLRLSILLTQLNSLDFITYRLALLARYPRLRNVEITVLPFDPGSTSAVAFDLFPASDLAPAALDMAPIAQVEKLALVGALCDQRVVNILRAFRGVRELDLVDSFASRHLAPALAALDPSALRALVLRRYLVVPPPVDLPAQETDWARFAHLNELALDMPIGSPDALAAALPSFSNLSRVVFGASSDPSAALVQYLVANRLPPLREVVLSHVTGMVGEPLSPESLPAVASWLNAMRDASHDDASDDAGAAPGPSPPFPLAGWRLPLWSADFTPSDAEALFPLARTVGVALRGTFISACLTTFVLDRQVDLWLGGDGDGAESGAAVRDMGADEREVICDKSFWDALALRYAARLLEGMGEGGAAGGVLDDERMGASSSFAPSLSRVRSSSRLTQSPSCCRSFVESQKHLFLLHSSLSSPRLAQPRLQPGAPLRQLTRSAKLTRPAWPSSTPTRRDGAGTTSCRSASVLSARFP